MSIEDINENHPDWPTPEEGQSIAKLSMESADGSDIKDATALTLTFSGKREIVLVAYEALLSLLQIGLEANIVAAFDGDGNKLELPTADTLDPFDLGDDPELQ